jgi:hypothetical protein
VRGAAGGAGGAEGAGRFDQIAIGKLFLCNGRAKRYFDTGSLGEGTISRRRTDAESIHSARATRGGGLFLGLIIGCSDDLTYSPHITPAENTSPAHASDGMILPDGKLVSRPLPLEVLPELQITLASARAVDEPDDVLMKAIEEHDGAVFIGLKPADAARTAETGRVPSITRGELLEGFALLESLGVQIQRTYVTIPVVAARISSDLAPMLRRLPIVNYIEPQVPLELLAQHI